MRQGPFVLIAFCAAGCLTNEGEAPPAGQLRFPIAIATSAATDQLYIASSNFDLRYNAGSVQSYDLAVLNGAIDTTCDQSGNPEKCSILPEDVSDRGATSDTHFVPGLLLDEALIGSFPDGMVLSPAGDRLYIASRSDGSLTSVDLGADGSLGCGGTGARETCTDDFRTMDTTVANARDVELPPNPVALAVVPVADLGGTAPAGTMAIVMAHSSGQVSLAVDDPSVAAPRRPRLAYVLGGLATDLVNVTYDPFTRELWAPSSAAPFIARLGVRFLAGGTIDDVFVYDAGTTVLRGVDIGATAGNVREVALDPRVDGLGDPIDRAYVLARSPQALIVTRRAPVNGILEVLSIIDVGPGASRLVVTELATSQGPRLVAFVSCYDSRELYVIDADLGELVTIIRGVSGPFEIAIDTPRQRLYVLDFRTSVMRVIDLVPLTDCLQNMPMTPGAECSPPVIGLLGRPRALEELR